MARTPASIPIVRATATYESMGVVHPVLRTSQLDHITLAQVYAYVEQWLEVARPERGLLKIEVDFNPPVQLYDQAMQDSV